MRAYTRRSGMDPLPSDSIGISDINSWRDCPSRFEYSMRRWTEGSEPPERKHPDIMYGSAIHHAIEKMETGLLDPGQAAQQAFNAYGMYLDPEDMERLERDLATYVERDYSGVKAVAVEGEFKVPLLKHDGRQIYFRFKLDRLYQSLADPGHFIHIDWKSSKWRKTAKEIQADTQMWAYNFGIHEVFPECERLDQVYDQLMYGREPTTKSAEQRKQIKRWLKRQVRAILADDEAKPKWNEWCPWCALLPDCPEPKRTARFAAARIAALAPPDPESGKLALDPDLIETYVSELPTLSTAKRAIEEFESKVRGVLREMPEAERAFFGYETFTKNADAWSPAALRAAHEVMGDEFYALIGLTKTKIKDYLPADDPRRETIMELAERTAGQPQVRKMAE